MENPNLDYEDMKFFECRLTEVISGMQPRVKKWRILLAIVFLSTVYSAYFWILDPSIRFVSLSPLKISLSESLVKHPLFSVSCTMLLFLFFVCGVHKKVVAPKIIAMRCRSVLADFCLSCDENGKLIVRPAYSTNLTSTPMMKLNVSSGSSNTPRQMTRILQDSGERSGLVVSDDYQLLSSGT